MTARQYTADEITEGISLAVQASDMPAVETLLYLLAATDMQRFIAVVDAMEKGLTDATAKRAHEAGYEAGWNDAQEEARRGVGAALADLDGAGR